MERADQYFTPRPLIRALANFVRSEPIKAIAAIAIWFAADKGYPPVALLFLIIFGGAMHALDKLQFGKMKRSKESLKLRYPKILTKRDLGLA